MGRTGQTQWWSEGYHYTENLSKDAARHQIIGTKRPSMQSVFDTMDRFYQTFLARFFTPT